MHKKFVAFWYEASDARHSPRLMTVGASIIGLTTIIILAQTPSWLQLRVAVGTAAAAGLFGLYFAAGKAAHKFQVWRQKRKGRRKWCL